MLSRIFALKFAGVLLAMSLCSVTLSSCQKVSLSRVSSKYGNVQDISTKFVSHYLDTDSKTFANSQASLKQDASPGLIQTMKKNGVLAKDDKALKAKTAQLAKRKGKESVMVKEVKEGDVGSNGLMQAIVTGEIQKSTGAVPFTYVLGLGIRKDTNKLAVVTITKQ